MASNNVLLLGFTVPDAVARKLFSLDASPAIQTHKFAWSLARALQSGFGKIVLASACPIQNYPLGRKLLFRGARFEEQEISGVMLGFVNLLVLKHLSRFLACLLSLPGLIVRHKINWIFIHGTHSPFLLFGLLARLWGRKLAVILTDPPGVLQPTDSALARGLKRLDVWLVSRALAHADAVIALAPELVKRFAVRGPSLVFPGILNSSFARQVFDTNPEMEFDDYFTVMYAGGLSKAYGIDLLLDAVAGLSNEKVRLKLFGRGDLEARIVELVALDDRFQYGGFVDNDQLIPELSKADVLVNPRPTKAAFAVMSFPSKLIEYMAMGRPVLTTRIASIPESYRPHFFFIDEESVIGIRKAIVDMIEIGQSVRETRAVRGQAFILADASEVAVGKKIVDLIQSASRIN